MVDWWAALRFDSHQLHRSANTVSTRTILKNAVSMEQPTVRNDCDCISYCILSWTNSCRSLNRSRWNAQGSDHHSHLVLNSRDANVVCCGTSKFCLFSFP